MSTNTIRHVSDESVYKTFDPAGTSFPANVTNVQQALASISLDGVNGLAIATETVAGKARLATQAEVDAGAGADTIVTPVTLNERLKKPQATETVAGITRYATDAEAITGAVKDAAIVPSSLKASLDNAFTVRLANEITPGVIKISTTPQALAGADDSTAMSPLKVAQAINDATQKIPSYGTATTTSNGLVRIATTGEVAGGTVNDGVAVSPFGLSTLTATQARKGLVQLATADEVSSGSIDDKAITPLTLLSRKGAQDRFGVVKLQMQPVWGGDDNTALRWDAAVLRLNDVNQQQVGGPVNFQGQLTNYGKQVATVDMIYDSIPVGVIMMWASNAPLPAKWHDADGWADYVNAGPEWNPLKAVYPGGLPDMRGLFVRGAWRSNAIAARDAPDHKGKKGLGYGCSGGAPGEVQPQQISRHKHATGWGERLERSWAQYGTSVNYGYLGSQKTDWDNWMYFTNDGTEIEPDHVRDEFGTMNPVNLIGEETRPWNMSVRYIVKIL